MTTCDKCRVRGKCKIGTRDYKNYCEYCGCLEDVCHCSSQQIIKCKLSKITLNKAGDCKSCGYRIKCLREQGVKKHKIKKTIDVSKLCGYCGCLITVCHCTLPTGLHQKDTAIRGSGKRKHEVVK